MGRDQVFDIISGARHIRPKTIMPSADSTDVVPLFVLRSDDLSTLAESDGFSILRAHLAEHHESDFCEDHGGAVPEAGSWLLVRDILHALLVPIVELFDKASSVSSQATQATKLEDLEYAYTGNARSAFIWLQCFLASEEERDWCFTLGCPACVVDHCLESEFCVRLLYAACLLSDVHYPFTLDGPTLPSFMFFLDSLVRALEEDPLYGPHFFELTKPKAESTREGVEDLIIQCMELDAELSQPSSAASLSPAGSRSTSPSLGPIAAKPGMKVKRSKIARQQVRMKVEEEQWVEDMIKKRWRDAQALNGERRNSSQLDLCAALAKSAIVSVDEVRPDR